MPNPDHTKGNAPTVAPVEASKAETQQASKASTVNSTDINTSAQLTPSLTIENGQVTTTSLQVAEHFGKRHDHVLRAIRNLECSADFRLLNFGEVIAEYKNGKGGTQQAPAYRITRDGFVFLAMGFTGKEAAQWKEAYITAFNRMERELVEKRPYSVSHSQTLSKAEGDTLRDMLSNFAKSLPKATQGEVMRQGWSKLKSHFKTDYRHIPASQFTEAVNILSRHMAAWSKADTTALPAPTGIERMLITKNLATGETTVENLGTASLLFKSPDHIARAVMDCRLGVEVTQKIAQHAMMGMMANAVDLKKQIRSQAVTETLNQMASLPVADLVELSTSAHTFLSGMALKTPPPPTIKGDRLMDAALAASAHA